MHPVPFRRDESLSSTSEKILTATNTQRNKGRGIVKKMREVVWELLFVKNDHDDYIRPWLRTPGSILEGLLLMCILASLMVSIMDSFSSWEPQSPESRCWEICCNATHGRCKPDVCEKHKHDTEIEPECAFALGWVVVRDLSIRVLMAIFTVEYLGRLWTCVENPHFSAPVSGRIAWMRLPLSLVDLFSVLPFYLDLFFSADDDNGPNSSYVLRTIRLLRIMTVLRLERPLKAIHVMLAVCARKSEELLVTLFGACVLILLFGSFMYILEFDENPDMFPNIPAAMWWCVNCLSTVGYGDSVPITPAGQCLGAMAAFLGVGLFAMPAGILGSGFLEVYEERKTSLHVTHKADSMWEEKARTRHRRKKMSKGEREREKAKEKANQAQGGREQAKKTVSHSSDEDTPGEESGGGGGGSSTELVTAASSSQRTAAAPARPSSASSSPIAVTASSSLPPLLRPELSRSNSVLSYLSEAESWHSDGQTHQQLADLTLRVEGVESSIKDLHTMMGRQEALLLRLLEASQQQPPPAAASGRPSTNISFV